MVIRQLGEGDISIAAVSGTDLWSKTCWTHVIDNAPRHYLHDTIFKNIQLHAECDLHEIQYQHDQVGLLVYFDGACWTKFCVELEPTGLHFCCVITTHGFSDCSYVPCGDITETIRLICIQKDNYLKFGYINSVGSLVVVRVAPNPFPASAQIGVFAGSPCSPVGGI